jgi:cold shock CspA family protein
LPRKGVSASDETRMRLANQNSHREGGGDRATFTVGDTSMPMNIAACWPRLSDRTFGFIKRPGAADVFFHRNDLCTSLDLDEQLVERRVVFEVAAGKNGKDRAAKVRAAD